jgi:DNA-binding GntR family transcriptional regulator
MASPPTSAFIASFASASNPDSCASERDLAKIHQVSLMTARHALATLEREGIVERRRACAN